MANNYTLGRGELHFGKYLPGTTTPGGELYFGNTTELNLSAESNNLDHYNSDRGVKVKDESVLLELNRTGSFVTDNISVDNLALFFFGTTDKVAQAASTITNEAIPSVIKGATYQLGMTPTNPAGVTNLDLNGVGVNVVVTDVAGTTTYVEGTDYSIDMAKGRLTVLPASTMVANATIHVDYKTLARSRNRVLSGSTPIAGALRYIAYNPAGEQIDFYMPFVKITPNGDFALKGDEWQTIPFNIEVLKPAVGEALYANGAPYVA
jgi:hypothetical protein